MTITLPQITIVGTMVADPELRFTSSGTPVASFRVVSNDRRKDPQTGKWEDGDATFLSCNVWRQAAENVAQSLSKGMQVIVVGQLKQREYQTRDGENRTVFEVQVDAIGPSLTFASATVDRNPRGGRQQGGFGGAQGGAQPSNGARGGTGARGGFGDSHPPSQADGGVAQNDPWSGSAVQGEIGNDNPPF